MSTATGAPAATLPATPAWREKVRAYVSLTKPRIIELLLIETVPVMFVAERGMPSLWLMIATVIGGTLSAGGANAFNMWWDRDIDAKMHRTARRPIVQGIVSERSALTFSLLLQVASFLWLWGFANLLSAALALSGGLFYMVVYTMWLKRSSSSNIVIGGAAGAVPVLVGWAAVTNKVELAPLVMFTIIFVWTPPHFWALAFKYRHEYKSVEVPMLPSVASLAYTAKQIVAYTLLLWVLSLALVPVAGMGLFYESAAVITGGIFAWYALKLQRDQSERTAMQLFHWSILYVTLLFGAMAVDQFLYLAPST